MNGIVKNYKVIFDDISDSEESEFSKTKKIVEDHQHFLHLFNHNRLQIILEDNQHILILNDVTQLSYSQIDSVKISFK
jgi:hypothetical protein